MRVFVILFSFFVLVTVDACGTGNHRDNKVKDRHKGNDENQNDDLKKECNNSHKRDREWEIFKNKFEKMYLDKEEEDLRRVIWEYNMDIVELHNLESNSYTVKMNKFGDLTPEEKKIRNGYKHKPKVEVVNSNSLVGLKNFDLKASDPKTQKKSINWNELGYVTPVKDQGECGACWAFSATGALEAANKQESGDLISLSEQNLIDCNVPENAGCDGGAMIFGYEYVVKNRQETNDTYPYIGKNGKCHYKSSEAITKIKGYVIVPEGSEEDLRMAVSAVGPVAAAINANQHKFWLYHEGIYDEKGCNPMDLNHGALVVGYGTDDGVDYWLIKNSWGTDWGMKGYMKLARNHHNECGIATETVYPIL